MKKVINSFVKTREIAIAGATQDRKKWGNMLLRSLIKKGYLLYPVNPKYDQVEGLKCYQSVSELPDHIENLILATPPCATEEIVKDCKESGIKRIWMHQGGGGSGAHSASAIEYVKDNNMELVYGLCPMMFFKATGIHRFHYWIKKVTGKMPVEFSID